MPVALDRRDRAYFRVAVFLPHLDGVATQQPTAPTYRFEILAGRLLAVCAHPVAAWRCSDPAGRLALVGGYTVAGYIVVLLTLAFRT